MARISKRGPVKSEASPARVRRRARPANKASADRVTAKANATSGHPETDPRAERRDAILNAALEEFTASGFAAARMEDVAKRAGVAKGTLYLYFRDKEALFQELIRSIMSPLIGKLESAPFADLPFRALAEAIIDLFVREIYGTRRKDVIRLMIAEGPRFPKLAEFYYHEVIENVLGALRGLLERAVARGEVKYAGIARFPHLLVAPGVVAIVWNGLFDRFAPLDVAALMRAHLDLVLGEEGAS
jgi:AcrR family transcriptional regulator